MNVLSGPLLATPGSLSPAELLPAAPVSLEGVAALLRGLNREQRSAVTHRKGPLLVVAGPGTGKTEVVTRRVAWLIATKRAQPREILALTFTERAASEMQARVDLLVPYGQADAAIHTFHAFGDALLREFAFELGRSTDLRVLSRAEAVILLREHLFELDLHHFRPLGDPTRFLGALVGLFHRAKDEGVSPAAYAAHAATLEVQARSAREAAIDEVSVEAAAVLAEEAERQAELARVYSRYEELLGSAGCLDFGDQVALAATLLRDHPAARAQVQDRFRYILVDEFQDTNSAQLELVELVAGRRANVTVVGDDDQAIYAFRGAALENILGFRERFGASRAVVLRRNHRSLAPILAASHRLVRHNDPERLESRAGLDKRLVAHRRRRNPSPVRSMACATPSEEADWVARGVAERINAGTRARDIAILVRTNADADRFLRSLAMEGVPSRFSGASGLYARPEVRELLAFFRAVADPDSTVDLYAVATGQPYRLGGSDMTSLLAATRRRHRSLWAILEELQQQPGILRVSEATRSGVARLLRDLRASMELAHERPAGEVLYDHLKRSGRLGELIRLEGADGGGEAALQNVARLFEIVREGSRLLTDSRVPFLVRHLETLIQAGDDPASAEPWDDAQAVSVLTVHKAKGLEFAVVYLVGLVEGRFPGRSRRDQVALPSALAAPGVSEGVAWAEERRLFYVAMTRARDELLLTWAASDGAGRRVRPSPFIGEALDCSPASLTEAGVARSALVERLAALERPADPASARPPSLASDGPLNLSFSALDDYLTCPLKYRMRHVLGVPMPPHHALVYGNALHQAVAAFGQHQQRGEAMSEQALLLVFAAHWSSEGFLSRAHEGARYQAGQDALRRFRSAQLAAPSGRAPLGVEKEFLFRLGADRVRGRFDRIDDGPSGEVITDFKSGEVRDQRKADRKARESLQLSIYALAREAETGKPPASVQLHFLDSGVVGSATPDARRLEAARQRVFGAAARIREGLFPPRPDAVACGYCPFRDICPSSAA